MGNSANQPDHREVDLPLSENESIFYVETFRISPSGMGRTLPKRVAIKLCEHCAELWALDFGTKRPCDIWSFCNIVSWGHNEHAVRLVVVGQQLVRHELVNRRYIYDFKSSEGAEIVASLKRITHEMTHVLRQAQKTRRGSLGSFAPAPTPALQVVQCEHQNTESSGVDASTGKISDSNDSIAARVLRAARFPRKVECAAPAEEYQDKIGDQLESPKRQSEMAQNQMWRSNSFDEALGEADAQPLLFRRAQSGLMSPAA